ncbi:MAG: hypothetical protein QXK24_05825 [Ignisphaera sp.]
MAIGAGGITQWVHTLIEAITYRVSIGVLFRVVLKRAKEVACRCSVPEAVDN